MIEFSGSDSKRAMGMKIKRKSEMWGEEGKKRGGGETTDKDKEIRCMLASLTLIFQFALSILFLVSSTPFFTSTTELSYDSIRLWIDNSRHSFGLLGITFFYCHALKYTRNIFSSSSWV